MSKHVLMKNTATHHITVESPILFDHADDDISGAQKVRIPPGGIVKVVRAYAVPALSPTGAVIPSAVERLSGGYLKPHGKEAEELLATTFQSELPEVVAAIARAKVRASKMLPGVSATADAEEEQREVNRQLRAAKEARDARARLAPEAITLDETEVQ